jgi:two-component system, cell cycle sensor histidine kinase and response regulator CckA
MERVMVNLSSTESAKDKTAKKILVIDDEEPVREAVKDILEMINIEVMVAPDGANGIELYQQQQGDIILVLLDLSMPGMNGEETFLALRKINPNIQVLLSSGYSETEINSRFAGKNVTGFIQKPYTLDTLIERVQAFLH